MRRVVVVLFALSDWLCWLIIFLSVLWAVVTPVANLSFWPKVGVDVSVPPLLLISVAPLLVAAGAFALLKRRLVGFAPLLLPATFLFIIGETGAGIVAVTVVGLLFVLPYAIVFLAGPQGDSVIQRPNTSLERTRDR